MNQTQGVINIKTRMTEKQWLLLIVFYMLLMQSALEQLSPVFTYIDEGFALFGAVCVVYRSVLSMRLRVKKTTLKTAMVLTVFLVSGLLGNILYGYQPTQYVLIDLFTNVKFFLSILTGYYLFKNCKPETQNLLAKHARFAAVCFFGMLLADQLFHVFPSPETRYGLRVSQLTHTYATYLAGSMVFLLAILTIFYKKHNKPYIIMSLVVLFFTLRGKAVAGVAVYVLLTYFILVYRKKLRWYHLVILGLVAVFIAWDQFSYYYIELEGQSARSVLTQTSIEILKDYFPIGTGFGTYASASAGEHYSPVYEMYGFLEIYELGGNASQWGFFSDTFWPIIIGQTGFIGVICYVIVLILLFLRILRIRNRNIYAYVVGLFLFVYLLISSTSEPAFNNSVAIPIAAIFGYIFSLENQHSREELFDRNLIDRC